MDPDDLLYANISIGSGRDGTEPGLVLPFTVYSGFADARIIETLESWEDRRRAG